MNRRKVRGEKTEVRSQMTEKNVGLGSKPAIKIEKANVKTTQLWVLYGAGASP